VAHTGRWCAPSLICNSKGFTRLLLIALSDIHILFTFTFLDSTVGSAWKKITKGLVGKSAILHAVKRLAIVKGVV